MTRPSISLIAVLLFVSCSSHQPASNINQASPTPTAPAFVRDGKGNVIKSTGWDIPILPSKKTYEKSILPRGEEKIGVLVYFFIPKEKMLITIPKSWEDGDLTYTVERISEIKGENQPPYCYQFYVSWPDPANHPGVSTFFAYHDDDGDGIFETLSDGCTVPTWVK